MNQTITVVIPALNEERNIERCINSLRWCDKVIVIWMGQDKTGAIAKKLGAEVYTRRTPNTLRVNDSFNNTLRVLNDFRQVQKNINWAIDHCKTDWMLRIDADEVVTDELKKEILLTINSKYEIRNTKQYQNSNNKNSKQKDLINSNFGNSNLFRASNFDIRILPVAYGIPRSQYFCGGFLKGGDWAYDRLVRLFQPQFCRYDPIVSVHEQFKVIPVNGVYGVNGQIGYLKNKLLHYSHPTLKDVIDKFQKYTDMEAKELHITKFSAFWNMFTQPVYVFLRWTFWHHGYRDGFRGVLAGLMRGWYEYLKYSKYLFHNNG